MSDQLGQLLGYFDNDGVTELVIHTGQPISVRINGEYRAVTEGTVSKPQLAHLMLGTPLDALTPEDERNSESRVLELGGRQMHALLIKRGKEITLTLGVAPPEAPPPAHSTQITKPAARTATSTIPPPKPIPAVPTAPPAVPPPVPPVAARPTPAAAPPAVPKPVPPVATSPRQPTPGAGIRVATPLASSTASSSDSPVEIHSAPPAREDVSMPAGPPGIKLELDDEEDNATSFGEAPSRPAVGGNERYPRAVSISADTDEGMPDLDSGLPRDVRGGSSGAFAVPDLDTGWAPELEPAIPRSATRDRAAMLADAPPPARDPRAPSPDAFAPPAVAAFTPPTVAPAELVAPVAAHAHATQLVDEPVTVTKALEKIVAAARAANASDLHIAAHRPLSIRTMSELKPLDPKLVTPAEAEAVLMPLLGPMRRKQLAERGYVDLAVEVAGGGRLRCNISRIQGGLKGAFRLALPRPFTLDELSLPKELVKVVSHHQGLVVIAGPSGHGKTTTLAALVDLVNSTRKHHILTVEDPVEIEHPRKAAVMSQREVGRHTRSFAAALKASLREDPDVIVIGELRDRETVEIAMTAAETGHLVIATMSTPSAAKTIDRLIDMFPPDDQSQVRASLAGALRAIVSQRLVPTKDGKVTPAIELLTGVLPLAVLIRDNKLFQLPNLMQRGRALGMVRLDESLIDLVRRGKISEETALANADSKKEMTVAFRMPTTGSIPKVTK